VDVLDIKFYGKSAHASENADEALNALDAMISYMCTFAIKFYI
jgi:metal-dependent amidase/aminoacylase/carboxypeptidase family protein